MQKLPIRAEFRVSDEADALLRQIQQHNLKVFWRERFAPRAQITVQAYYPHGGGRYNYMLPEVESGDTAAAFTALRQLEQQGLIDPDHAQEARSVLARIAEYMRS